MKNSITNKPNNEKVKRKMIFDLGIFFLSESSFVSPRRSAYLVIVIVVVIVVVVVVVVVFVVVLFYLFPLHPQ